MSKPTSILILGEDPPPLPDRPASGLALRHLRMAQVWASQGAQVTLAWPGRAADECAQLPNGCHGLALDSPDELAVWLRRQRPEIVVLGYWELHDWLPGRIASGLVLDFVAPRLLERQYEDRDRLAGDAAALLPLLARADEVWVGNRRQADLMLGWLLLAGHDCRTRTPIRIVPIAGQPALAMLARGTGALKLFHGGRDWPWRKSGRWLDALNVDDPDWRLEDFSEQAGFGSWSDYGERLAGSDVLLELADENVERRFSQSFRMVDALCAGVPVICNRFLPLAPVIEQAGAGWVIDAPEQLPALLREIANDRDEHARRARAALELARQQFDSQAVYGQQFEHLADISGEGNRGPRRPLLAAADSAAGSARQVLADYLRRWIHHRLRLPFHRWLGNRLADRPQPGASGTAWVVVSRPDIFPTHHGAAVKIERTAWGLSFQVDEVLLLTDRRDGYWRYCRGEREFRRFPRWLRLPGWPRAFNIIRVMLRGLPYSNAFLYLPLVDRGLHLRLMWLLGRHPVAVVQGEFPAYAHPAVWAARLFGTGSLMVEHNVEYQRIADQVAELSESARLKLKRIEVDLANACDKVITVSGRDREMLIQAGVQEGRLRTIPHGVDLQHFDSASPVDLRARYSIPADHAVLVYHGIYSYPPNLEAVEELSTEILPRLAAAGHPATVVALGPEPPDGKLEGVVFTGAVDDLAGHLKGADLAVIPLRAGGGTRMKILDDFAAGVPVISTAKGMEGIPVEHGRHLLIVDDADEIAAAVVELLGNPDRRAQLAGNARAWVEAFDWREIARRYVELMGR
ncbi:MAG: glycosyltransferase [Wenzhouxiangellaceae bacterium]